MLPEILSNSLASPPGRPRPRYTVSAIMEFDPDGVRTAKTFARSAIKVDHRFAYEEVFEILQHPDGEAATALSPELREMLKRMLELAMILRGRRFKRGALELSMPEVEIDLGEQGEVVGAHLASNDVSHQIIEDFMLAANEAVASHLTEHQGRLPPPGPRRPRAAQAPPLRRLRPEPRLRDPAGPEPVRAPEAPPTRPRRSPRPTPSTSASCGASSRRSTRPSRKGITPWRARIIATSPRRSAAIPTSRSTASSRPGSPAGSPGRTTTSWSRSPSTAPRPSVGPSSPSAS